MGSDFVWGSLSTAKIGYKVLPGTAAGKGMVVKAVASRDADKAAAYAAELGIPVSYGSYEELLADPEIDAIYNPLPNDMHVPWSIKAMEAGKHVLCEKPIALTAEEAATLIEAQKRTGRFVVEAFMVRHHPQWKRARERVQANELGQVRAMQIFVCYPNTDSTNIRNIVDHGGGSLYDIGCYAINTSRFIFGAEPERVAAVIDRDPDFGTDRLTSAILDYGGGRHVTFATSTQLAEFQRVSIYGTEGRIEIHVPLNAMPDRGLKITFDDGRDLLGGGAEDEVMPIADQYTLQAEAFVEHVRTADVADVSAIEDSVANMKAIDAVFRAAKSDRWEAV